MSLKYHIWTIGCQMNDADTRHLASQLEALGYNPTGDGSHADLVVLNTCVVRQQAEDKAVGRLVSLKAEKARRPDMTIGLMGCMVGMREAPRLRERFPFVDVFMPPSDTEPLLEYLETHGSYNAGQLLETQEKALRDAIQDNGYALPAALRGKSVTANVPIVLGCSHACTFCVIPYRRGAERSRCRDEIFREIYQLVAQGVREVTLLGQIVDRYGTDLEEPYDLAELLEELDEVHGLDRIRFLTSHPNWMTDRLIETATACQKVCPQFEVPAQAGNDEVLERMRRGYTNADYRRVVDRIRDRVPEAAVHTDIIVGFPGETERQFEDTYRLLEELGFEKVHIAKYSERPKTIAARRLPDDVDPDAKEHRRKRLDELQASILEEKNKALQGQVVQILVEDRRKGRWRGRTRQGKLVFLEDDRDLRGQLVDVRIEWTGPYSLIGGAAREETPAEPPRQAPVAAR